jgi:hypothetical protein
VADVDRESDVPEYLGELLVVVVLAPILQVAVMVNFVFFFVRTNFSFLTALLATDYVARPVVEITGEVRERRLSVGSWSGCRCSADPTFSVWSCHGARRKVGATFPL